ncbi:MAG: Mu-like prophage major head subunit gpT family protein [Rhodospirillales bacterium]|nr:Mu-like prophage major head subunit gpT family protein [Rhodospirillales bacterium]
MIINNQNLKTLFTGFSVAFNMGFEAAPPSYKEIASIVPSSSTEELYGWLGNWPQMREWVGDRIIKNLVAHDYTIKNRKFEDTVSVPRDKIEDDKFGVFGPYFQEMGRLSATHPDELIFELLLSGFANLCYDGQNFFDADHPVVDKDGATQSVSNIQAGAGDSWFLIDASKAIRPLIFQERIPYKMQSVDADSDTNVFLTDEYLYGVRARVNAGFGLWQLAFGSKAELDATNFEAALKAMAKFTAGGGRKLNVRPTHLIVGPSNEGKARRLLKNGTRVETVNVGGADQAVPIDNEWAGTAELIVSPHLD